MQKSIFITRDLSSDSPFHHLDKNYRVLGHSLLEFQTITVDQWPESDWLFFYSQQGVIHFCKQANTPENVKIATFGPRTGLKCKNEGMSVDFTGNGKAVATAQGLRMVARNESILFIRAQTSLRSVQKILGSNSSIYEAIVYTNVPKGQMEKPEADILIFTSPLNVKTYFSSHSYEKNQQVIAIGQTTATALAELGIYQVHIPNEASEESMVRLISTFDL